MPYPVAHGLLGAANVAALGQDAPRKRRVVEIAAGAFIAILPDFDYGFRYLVHHPGRTGYIFTHHGLTHSLVFTVILGAITAAVSGRFTPRIILAFVLAAGSHPALDYFFTEGVGIAILWPITPERYRFAQIKSFYHEVRSGESGGRFLVRLAIASVIEAAVFLPVLGAALWWRRRRSVKA